MIEEIIVEEDSGDEAARASPVAPPPSIFVTSPAVVRVKGKKNSAVLSVSSEDMEKQGVEFMLQRMMEQCCEEADQEEDDDE